MLHGILKIWALAALMRFCSAAYLVLSLGVTMLWSSHARLSNRRLNPRLSSSLCKKSWDQHSLPVAIIASTVHVLWWTPSRHLEFAAGVAKALRGETGGWATSLAHVRPVRLSRARHHRNTLWGMLG